MRGLRADIVAKLGEFNLDVKLDTGPGTLAVVGPNGAGKSSLLLFVLGVLRATKAFVQVGDVTLQDTQNAINAPTECRRLGYVPQDYALFPHMTVRQNIKFAMTSAKQHGPPRTAQRSVESLLHELALEPLAERLPPTLSGGERQRVALARALAVDPIALLLDEPFAALDLHTRAEVREFLAAFLDSTGLPTLLVTHDWQDARALGHRIFVLEAGSMTQTGTWLDLTQHPATRFVETFVSAPRGYGLGAVP
jgi:molybdate transport system ATP-binding protein